MKKFQVFYFLATVFIAVAVFAPNVRAYDDWDGCKTCHGSFRDSSYQSLKDDVAWGDDLHDVHRNEMLSRECEACHSLKADGSRLNAPVYNGRSEGESSKGLAPLSCNGCHGRQEDGGFDNAGGDGYGAGLRQQHTRAGEYDCTDCHSDADPESFTVVGENILPPYYRDGTGVFELIPRDACNPGGFEDFAAATIGLDNDGDGLYDLDDPDCQQIEMCPDSDNDGFVVSDGVCEIPADKQAGDCDDTNPEINPDASEICNNDIDEDCNGEDYICDPCQDLDGDNYHDPAFPVGCVMPADSLGEDCNDSDADTNPGASEVCGNDTDEDCNGEADACLPCQDSDGDGYHNPDSSPNCTAPANSLGEDCNDEDSAINPGATEICGNDTDEDCNGEADACLPCQDLDNDGYHNPDSSPSCTVPLNSLGEDCNDEDSAINPGASEICGNNIDENCDGIDDVCLPDDCADADRDGYHNPDSSPGCVAPPNSFGEDCNDEDSAINPGASEICGNNIDENCDGIDDVCLPDDCADADRDGYHNPDSSPGCVVPPNSFGEDCNDDDSAINPGASEICGNNIDENCDGVNDVCPPKECVDADGDGYHSPDSSSGCVVTLDSLGEDCNDNDPTINPGASEICGNNIDENCDGIAEVCPPEECADVDGDGYYNPDSSPGCTIPVGSSGVDCNDDDYTINPGNSEICDDPDNVDEDCNGLSNSADPVCINQGEDSDYDFVRISCPESVYIEEGNDGRKAKIIVTIENNGDTDPGALLSVKAMQDNEMKPIANTGISVEPGEAKQFEFCVLATMPGEIKITAEIEDEDPDVDMVMCTVLVKQKDNDDDDSDSKDEDSEDEDSKDEDSKDEDSKDEDSKDENTWTKKKMIMMILEKFKH